MSQGPKTGDRIRLTTWDYEPDYERGERGTVLSGPHLIPSGPGQKSCNKFRCMLDEPLPHLLIGPRPRKGMGVEAIVLRSGGYHMLDQFLPFAPGVSLQIAMPECSDQQLRLVQPRGVGWGEAGPPPTPALRPVDRRVP